MIYKNMVMQYNVRVHIILHRLSCVFGMLH